MTRDWLLTLLALSPYFLAATIVVIALTRKPTQPERTGRGRRTISPRGSADQAGRRTMPRQSEQHDLKLEVRDA